MTRRGSTHRGYDVQCKQGRQLLLLLLLLLLGRGPGMPGHGEPGRVYGRPSPALCRGVASGPKKRTTGRLKNILFLRST
jgi:hypothetical protein